MFWDYSIGPYFPQVLLHLNLIPIFEKMMQFGPFLLNLLYCINVFSSNLK